MHDEEYEKLERLLLSHRQAINKATSTEEIADIIAKAKSQAGTGDWAYIVYPGVFGSAMERAYLLDPDGQLTSKLEAEWVAATANTDWPVQPSLIQHKRAEARYWKVLRPMATRHDDLCKNAKAPAELLSIVEDVTVDTPPEMDDRFRTAALCEAYAAAWLLDSKGSATLAIAEALNNHVGGDFAKVVSKKTEKERRRRKSKSA